MNKFPKSFYRNGKQVRDNQPKIIRYADDFVIIHNEYEVILQCKEIIAQWLKKAGLELKPEKTSIRHTLKSIEHDGQTVDPGFDFLGFNIRSYSKGKHRSGKTPRGKIIGSKTLIKPSKKKILAHHEALKEVIKDNKKAPQAALIARLNPIILGWCNYYRTVASKETFASENNVLWNMLRAWTVNRKKKKHHCMKPLENISHTESTENGRFKQKKQSSTIMPKRK
ncbi:Retron-type reverse transcriptase [Crocosphaera watsonii WH 0005]|uniref:Retron-type reverse transcriptase n=1 Tax=Crocosphaera watsonii WH 0005 TaxID=423472 RepID=T2IQD3_CROWT|nr:Retron-type reverse transcriptase [Crocosphaera watsonii WH 0005]